MTQTPELQTAWTKLLKDSEALADDIHGALDHATGRAVLNAAPSVQEAADAHGKTHEILKRAARTLGITNIDG